MALNSTLTFQLKSVVQNATFPHKGDFNDGCITYLDVTGTPGNTSFAFNSPPGVTLDCGPHDFHGRFRRYFDGVHNGAAYPASIGYNSASHYAERRLFHSHYHWLCQCHRHYRLCRKRHCNLHWRRHDDFCVLKRHCSFRRLRSSIQLLRRPKVSAGQLVQGCRNHALVLSCRHCRRLRPALLKRTAKFYPGCFLCDVTSVLGGRTRDFQIKLLRHLVDPKLLDPLLHPKKVKKDITKLVKVMSGDEVRGLIDRPLRLLFACRKYAERRGAAYGIAGTVKGRGLSSLKEHGVMSSLKDAVEDK
ncbi:hypothetical protein BJ741DRAFT_375674 [Chytriomyces cf. hyalinus JEL632]|nr:hypothetical protein BJ741DRAFT_375674 [Chytriomyces cf. hyalinus JEL632]